MRVFVSSTFDDLIVHRGIVEASLSMSGIPYNAMEHFGSTPRPSIVTCLNAVDSSDVFVGILGVRYGGYPPGLVQSYTQREYGRARSRGLPIFMFLIDERNAVVAPEHMARDSADKQERLRSFKEFVLRHHTVSFFTTPEDLARLVLASLIREFGVL